ncbi:unnamed protein product [Rotaria sp. Silwood1]|nr:unnamed protein product [Rotaria sp. Silwood1]CAF0753471.1 unnamed protein product [Rotaria sp. Silwood1]CAF3359131.1 unnamed protein product [Rotaria sp. Silwood1]CAF3363086.1 unnamed protein product [Rotaria sp. Silwood1]CAF4625939.1 unnamed protein product [Rotaria sp. Silwood1]
MAAGPPTSSNNPPVLPMHDKTPLSHLLEAAVQKTYHELYTMADVLSSKTNLERKKELVKFACRTRQLFIRILAVVKWATTAGKVNACESIQHFLDNRARLIRETSDSLAQLARIRLLDARLPNFPITDAVDALTLGSVNFLPERLSEGTTPFIPANESERQEILPRLQQILTARLAIAELPIQFTNVTIKNGIVTLAVDGEFEVKLGIKSDNLFASWHVYKTKLFLRDPEEPEQELVHPIQMQALTSYIQSWLAESENPLVELYRYLHYYCQSLRLHILNEQAIRIRNRSLKQRHLYLSSYMPCKSLSIEYWKEYNLNHLNHQQKKIMINEKIRDIGMTILCDDDGKFQIIHWPPLPIEDSVAILQIVEKPTFTMEEILNRTICARCQRRFEELKETILSTTSADIEIDPSIPALKCELLPESRSEEILFISISPFSGLYKVVSYMETRYSQQIEYALNRDPLNLIEAINLFKIWLIQQRIPSLLAHLNCHVYTRIPSLNPKHELIIPFINNGIYIELIHNEGYYILVHVSDVNQLLIQYYLLIVDKRSSIHDPLVIQQQNIQYNQPAIMPNDECAKWMLEPLVLCPLDPTAFLRKESIEFKNTFQFGKIKETIEDDMGIRQARSTSVLSLKLLLKLVNYYDEMLTFTFLKEEFQRKKTICKGIIYSPWTGIPYLDIVRTSTGDDSFSSNTEISTYVNEYFWPRILSCTIRLVHPLRDTNQAHKHSERQWTLELNLPNNNYFHNSIIKTPYNSIIICNQILAKLYSRIVDYIHSELRAAFELTHLFENYALSLPESMDLRAISEVNSFNFFKSTIHYGPNFAFAVTLTHNTNQNQQDLNSNFGWTFDLRFTTTNHKFLTTAHQILNGKLIQFLNRTRSLKQFIRLLHMTAIPISSIARLNCFNRSIVFVNQGSCIQPILTFVPYTEFRWRLIFGQIFALDIQICGPNLILIRDGAFSVQLNSVLPELSPIPRLKEFLSKYADDRGLTFEFTHITDRFRDRDFILPELQLPPPSFPISTTTIANPPSNRPLTSGNAPTPHLLHPVGTPGSSLNPLTPASVGPSSQSQQQANSPSQPIIAPSPGFMSTGSPLMMPTMGSPMPNNTPATQLTAPSPMGITTQSPGTIYEIPYISPAARPSGSTFPGSFLGPSPGTPANTTITSVATPLNIRSDDISNKQTSTLHSYNRHLYTKHYPVYMSQQTFFRMLFTPDGHQWSKFESFLASSVLVKHFARAVSDPYDSNNPTVRPVSNEQDTYRIEHLSLQIAFQFDINTATYRIHCTSLIDSSSQQQQQSNFGWSPDELQTMEIFLNENFFPLSILSNSQNQITIPTMDILSLAASTQNRNTAMGAFEKMLSHIHPRVLRDLIKIIRLEQNSENHHLWRARWCLTIPQGNGFTQVGHPAIYCLPGQASIFLFQFTPRLNRNEFQMSNNINTSSFIVPLTHDATTNQTTLWDRIQKQPLMGNEHRYHHVMKILNGSRESTNKYECSLFPSIAELISCLPVLPIANYSS